MPAEYIREKTIQVDCFVHSHFRGAIVFLLYRNMVITAIWHRFIKRQLIPCKIRIFFIYSIWLNVCFKLLWQSIGSSLSKFWLLISYLKGSKRFEELQKYSFWPTIRRHLDRLQYIPHGQINAKCKQKISNGEIENEIYFDHPDRNINSNRH